MAGAKPVLVDVNPHTLNIDPEAICRAITSRTRAIVPVHVSGRGADMEAIMQIAGTRGLAVVEDAAEGFVSRHRGKYLGTIGHAGCLSFSPNKTITTGQGGAVLTNDEALYVRLRELKDQGRPVRGTGGDDVHHSIGYNFKFTNLQAALGLGQLNYLQARLEQARRHLSRICQGLAGIPASLCPASIWRTANVRNGPMRWWSGAMRWTGTYSPAISIAGASGSRCTRRPPTRNPTRLSRTATAASKHALWLPSAFSLTDSRWPRVCNEIRGFLAEAAA